MSTLQLNMRDPYVAANGPTLLTSACSTLDHVHKPPFETVQAVAKDRAPAADLAQGRATVDRSAQTVQVAGRVRVEVVGRE
jgi:hypothetical protein